MRVFAATVLAAACGLALAARADENRPPVVVTGPSGQTYAVALQRFADVSTSTDGLRSGEFREHVAGALLYSGLFRVIDPQAFLGPEASLPLARAEMPDCAEWNTIGSDALVEGQIEIGPEKSSVEFRVWDTSRCRALIRRRYRQDASAPFGALAKRVADDVVQMFTGVRGVASTELTFVSNREGNTEIYVMDADGGNARRATANGSINNFPSWTPDGDAIVYTSYRHRNEPRLYLSTRGRGRPGQLLAKLKGRSFYRGKFSPSGQLLGLVMSDNGASDIYTARPDGEKLRRLTRNGAIDISPEWSPDGKQLAFVSDRTGAPQIYVMNADGGEVRRLTFDGSYNTNPAWSPDGRWIAYESQLEGQFDIWLIDPSGEGSGVPLVANPRSDEAPAWSPDSRKIAFSSRRRGLADIYVMDFNGENLLRLTQGAGDNTSPSWGPFPQ